MPKTTNLLFTCYLNCMCKSNPVCLIQHCSMFFLLASYVQWIHFLVWAYENQPIDIFPFMLTRKRYAVEDQLSVSLHQMNEQIFVLRFGQICLRTNSYADPNQHYSTNLNSHMHPSVHTRLGLVQFISFQSLQYYFCKCLPKENNNMFCTN